jgi:uncharacterized protein (DUF488 family)
MTTIFTIGHGNRASVEFVALLREAGVECVVDVRAHPASRRHPQFARDSLDKSLADAGIRYVWEGKALGGRRKLEKNSPHVALRNPAFRAYADHMATDEYHRGVERLLEVARSTPTAILCAEQLPTQCHRCLVADSLVARGAAVEHIIGAGAMQQHALNPLARPQGDNLVYDAGKQRTLKV